MNCMYNDVYFLYLIQKMGKERKKLLLKNEEISGRKAHTET